MIAGDSSKGTVATLIAQAQAEAGRENEALETTRAISLNRGVELPKVAHAFVQAGNRSGFKKLLLPSSYYLNACFEMTAQLAELYPEQAADIARVLKEQG